MNNLSELFANLESDFFTVRNLFLVEDRALQDYAQNSDECTYLSDLSAVIKNKMDDLILEFEKCSDVIYKYDKEFKK